MRITRDVAEQAVDLIGAGTSVVELCEGWGCKRSTLYSAIKRFDLTLPSQLAKLEPVDHVHLQISSKVPPEVYAYRAGISPETLRKYAQLAQLKLAMTKHSEKKAWWAALLDGMSYVNCKTFCRMHHVSVLQVAHWWHKIYRPRATLLWGYAQVITLSADDIRLFAYDSPSVAHFALGRGSNCVPISDLAARELYRASELAAEIRSN